MLVRFSLDWKMFYGLKDLLLDGKICYGMMYRESETRRWDERCRPWIYSTYRKYSLNCKVSSELSKPTNSLLHVEVNNYTINAPHPRLEVSERLLDSTIHNDILHQSRIPRSVHRLTILSKSPYHRCSNFHSVCPQWSTCLLANTENIGTLSLSLFSDKMAFLPSQASSVSLDLRRWLAIDGFYFLSPLIVLLGLNPTFQQEMSFAVLARLPSNDQEGKRPWP